MRNPILYLNLMKHDLVTVYDPEIVIYHKDGRSTNTVAKKGRDKLIFINKCYQESAKVLFKKIRKRTIRMREDHKYDNKI